MESKLDEEAERNPYNNRYINRHFDKNYAGDNEYDNSFIYNSNNTDINKDITEDNKNNAEYKKKRRKTEGRKSRRKKIRRRNGKGAWNLIPTDKESYDKIFDNVRAAETMVGAERNFENGVVTRRKEAEEYARGLVVFRDRFEY